MSVRKFFKKGDCMNNTKFKGSIFGAFRAPVPPARECPTGQDVVEGSYEQPDVLVNLKNGRKLHVLLGEQNLKLTLLKSNGPRGNSACKLSSVKIKEMIEAVARGVLSIDGLTLCFKDPIPLQRLLKIPIKK